MRCRVVIKKHVEKINFGVPIKVPHIDDVVKIIIMIIKERSAL